MARVTAVVMVALLLGGIGMLLTPPRHAEAKGPQHCRVGVYITSLREFDYSKGTFDAEMWVWALCRTHDLEPIKTMEFVNANDVHTRLYSIEKKNGEYWSQEKVRGTFRYKWSLRNFPFDHHTLQIQLEDGNSDIAGLDYVPDSANSTISKSLELKDWKVTGFHLTHSLHRYETTFGDPGLKSRNGSTYSQLRVDISIARNDYGSFIVLVVAVYMAIALGIATFFLPLREAGHRLSLCGAAVFVVVINLLAISQTLGLHELALVTGTHVLALLFLLAFVIVNTVSTQLVDHQKTSPALKLNRIAAVVAGVLFITLNAGMISYAINGA